MNTENNTQFAVKTAFVLKSGKRGRPVNGQVGQSFALVERLENGDVKLSRLNRPKMTQTLRPKMTWTFTAAQVAEWFNEGGE